MQILNQIFSAVITLVMTLGIHISNFSNSISSSSQLAAVAPVSGLVGYWNFNEGSGTTASDSSGNGNTGTLINNPVWLSGKVGSGALNFSGGYVTTPAISLGNSFSISAWVRPSTTNLSSYARIAETSYDSGFSLGVNSDATKYKLIVKNGSGATGSCGSAYGCAEGGAVTNNAWQHVTATYDGATARLYIDGVLVATETFTAPGNTNLSLNIGKLYYSPQNLWYGDMDEVRIYNRSISSEEVMDIYNDSGSGTTPDPQPEPSEDTTPPSTPINLSATAVSSSQINLSWTSSTDNTGVTGYRIYRGGAQIATSATNSYSNTALSPSTSYSYTVSAYDAAGNNSSQSVSVSATTQAGVTLPSGSSVTWTKQPSPAYRPGYVGWLVLNYDPVSKQALHYGGAPASVHAGNIYSTTLWTYHSGANSWTRVSGYDSPLHTCTVSKPNLPGDRHPDGQMTVDTKRNRLWLLGGVNTSCDSTTVNTNGTTVTYTGTVSRGPHSSWVGEQITINGAIYTVASVESSTSLTLTSSAGVQNGVLSNLTSLSNASPRQDMYYMSLNANPSLNTWTKVYPANIPDALYTGAMTYDEENDVIVLFGNMAGWPRTWVYCPSDTGTLDSKQTAAGCASANNWSQVAVAGNVYPPGASFSGLVYDSVNKKVLMFGGGNSSAFFNQLWQYNTATRQWTERCLDCVMPPVNNSSVNQPSMAFNTLTGKLLIHTTNGGSKDWQYDPVADTMTQLTSSGDSPDLFTVMTFDPVNNRLVAYGQYDGVAMWWGQLGSGSAPSDTTPPSTPTNLSATAVSSSQINLSWTASSDNVGVAGYRIYRGGTQISTSATNSYSNTALSPSTSYSYTVSAVDGAGNSSSQSSSASATTQVALSPSTKFKTGDRVQTTSNLNVRAVATISGTLLGTQSSGSLGTVVSGGTSSDGYYWWNVNYDSGVDGWSTEDYLTNYTAPASDVTSPSTPTNLSATAVSSSQINLSWTASTDNMGVTGYRIYRGGVHMATSTGNSYSDSGLNPLTVYSYTVAAIDAAYNLSPKSILASATTSVAPPLPTGSVISPLIIQEAIYPGSIAGITRTQDPVSVGIPLADSAGITSESQLGLSGTTLGQFRILGRWPSGNVKWVQVDTLADLSAGGQNTSISLIKASSNGGNFGGANLATDNGSTITVNTGSAQFIIKKANFNVIDQAVVNGKTIVSPSTSETRGLVLTGPDPSAAFPGNVTCAPDAGGSACATVYSSANDSNSTCSIEENGPVRTAIKCIGNHMDSSGNAYMQYTARLHFYKNKTGVKVTSVLRNANYDTSAIPSPDKGSDKFNTAYKGFKSYDLRISPSLSGTLNYTIAGHSSNQTGTLSGNEEAYVYQGVSMSLWSYGQCSMDCANSYLDYNNDKGYKIVKNGNVLASGTDAENQALPGWADISDSSGAGISIGTYQMSAHFPKSLEFTNGGGDVRIGIWPRMNSKPVYQAWPQWSIYDLYLNFHDASVSPTATSNEFLKFQHYLLARASRDHYNQTQVFPYPIPDPVQEDAYFVERPGLSNPPVSLDRYCPGGTTNCSLDYGKGSILTLTVPRMYGWSSGGGSNQEEFRWANMMEFLQRGYTGRWLNSAYFYRFQAEKAWPHADGTSSSDSRTNNFTWRSRPHAGSGLLLELDGFGRPNSNVIISANSTKSFTNWYDSLHFHWWGMTDYYFMTGDETARESMMPLKDWYLNNNTYQGATNPSSDSGAFGIVRAVAIEMTSSAMFGEFLRAIGDMDYSGVWAQGEKNYTLLIRPDGCLNGYPEGCVMPPLSGGAGKDSPGISRVRGFPLSLGGRGPGWCASGSGVYYRALTAFQGGMLVDSLLMTRNIRGPSWQYYKEALDLAYGVGKWATSEAYSDDGSNLWNISPDNWYNGFRYGVYADMPGTCPDGTPIVSGYTKQLGAEVVDANYSATTNATVWPNFYVQYLVTGSTDWKRKFDHALDRLVNVEPYAIDKGTYQVSLVIDALNNPSPVLQTLAPNVQNNGGGSYTLSWTVPQGTQSYRIKWGNKKIVDWIGYNPMANEFIGDPVNTMNWFAANNVASEPSPASTGSTQTYTLTGLPLGLTKDNFSVKAYIVGGSSVPIPDPDPEPIPNPDPAPIAGDFNADGLVNSIDLSLLTSAWNSNNVAYDLNKDGTVNTLDYAVMVQNWSI